MNPKSWRFLGFFLFLIAFLFCPAISQAMTLRAMFSPLFASKSLHADEAVTTVAEIASAVTVTAAAVKPTWYNGNWAFKAHLSSAEDQASLKAQVDAYKKAKESGATGGIVQNALWDSVVAWAWNNRGNRTIHQADKAGVNSDEGQKLMLLAKEQLSKGQTALAQAEKLPDAGESKYQTGLYKNENNERAKADAMLISNMTYVQRCLGEIPWPEKVKAAAQEDAEDSN